MSPRVSQGSYRRGPPEFLRILYSNNILETRLEEGMSIQGTFKVFCVFRTCENLVLCAILKTSIGEQATFQPS
jgi:hypothetical protein